MTIMLGEKIRVRRKRLKLTLDQLAEKTGSSRSYIWGLENLPTARPSAEKIAKLVRVFEVTVEFLLDDTRLEFPESDADRVLFQRIAQLEPAKRAQLEKFLNAIDD